LGRFTITSSNSIRLGKGIVWYWLIWLMLL
jgi:hypothetical protein